MSVRKIRRAAVLGAMVSMLGSAVAFADSVRTDGDLVTSGFQGTIDLGAVTPGAVLSFDVGLNLVCAGFNHVNPDQSVVLSLGSTVVPAGGSATATDTSIVPPGGGWPTDGGDCTGAPTPIPASPPSHVTLTAPTVPGDNYSYMLIWTRTLVPAATGDNVTFSGLSSLTVTLDVLGVPPNTAPSLTVPSDFTVEGNATGGAIVTFSASATDAEDAPDPTPTCLPASGSFFGLGPTTVSCQVTDSAGVSDSSTFTITVVDTTPPTITGMPGSFNLTTSDPAGAVVSYTPPTATDIVDPSPSVQCSPADGGLAPVGDSTLTCTAREASLNVATATVPIHVTLRIWATIWDEPIGAGNELATSGGRTIPVKVRLSVNGNEVTVGHPVLVITSCGGGSALTPIPLDWSDGNGRWSAHLDTSGLADGCYRVAAMIGGTTAGIFRLDIGTSSVAATKTNAATKDTDVTKDNLGKKNNTKSRH